MERLRIWPVVWILSMGKQDLSRGISARPLIVPPRFVHLCLPICSQTWEEGEEEVVG